MEVWRFSHYRHSWFLHILHTLHTYSFFPQNKKALPLRNGRQGRGEGGSYVVGILKESPLS